MGTYDHLEKVREDAARRGDWNLVAELDLELARYAREHGMTTEAAVADETFETTAVKRPRGRPRKVDR